ncbi:MAG TPA: ATP phosphoribosyltransferase regulatory subunit [Lachnospiraceae bacterium]|nr:ATP phosphoribosyltransferase regulatory subunit [Lachnospiraceae bacterium]HAP72494.1 ATP phosphoribosyltransferase regulatory subunit [Lachnospiraceae bacterium]
MSERTKQDLLHTPEGVWDHYGRDWAEYNFTEKVIGETLRSYGYEGIRTPSFEYFDVFSKEIGTTPSRELYKFFDREGDTIALRPDFTPGVARCTAKYYMDETKPLRFRYEGSAFINNSSLQGRLKEMRQTGAELMNDASVYADAEMIAMLVQALRSTGLSEFLISVGNVEYFKGICEAVSLDEETEETLRDYISGKNFFAAEDLLRSRGVDKRYQDLFLSITSIMKDAGELSRAAGEAPNERSARALLRLLDVLHVLKAYGADRYVSIDLSLLSRYHYYTGIIFKGYTYGVGDVIASGGRYDQLLSCFGKKAPAVGFMIPLDTLMEALRAQKIQVPAEPEPETLYYTEENFEEVLQEAKRRRDAGSSIALQKKE